MRILRVTTLVLALWPAPLPAQPAARADALYPGEFFIVSSVDPSKNQLLLKQPTEVTEVLRVDEKTRYLDLAGKKMTLKDLQAGDTVYVVSVAGTGGSLALEIRRGPMTLRELQRRYLRAAK